MSATTVWITAALRPEVEKELAHARDGLRNGDLADEASADGTVRRGAAVAALLAQLARESPSELEGVRVTGDVWELQDVAYSVMCHHFYKLSEAAGLFRTRRIDVAELRAGIEVAFQHLDLVQAVGAPERPRPVVTE